MTQDAGLWQLLGFNLKDLKSLWKALFGKNAAASVLKFNQQQVWKKFGEHYEEFGLSHSRGDMLKYLDVAQDVFRNPESSRTFSKTGKYAGETWYFKDGILLRLDPKGNFRSMYPYNE